MSVKTLAGSTMVALAFCTLGVSQQTTTPDDSGNRPQAEATTPQTLLRSAVNELRKQNLESAREFYRQAQGENSPDAQIGVAWINALESAGFRLAQKDRPAAHKYFHEAATTARELLKQPDGKKYSERLARAIYNGACAYSVDEEFDNALNSLAEAFEAGFTNFDHVANDPDFASLRDKPGFPQVVAKYRAAYRHRLLAEVKQELQSHQTYDFNFELKSVDGKVVAKDDFNGQVLIVDIWGTWCPPCRAEIPHFVKLHSEYGDRGLSIVGINYERGSNDEEKIKKIEGFMVENEMKYPCLLGDRETRDQVPGFRGYPTTIFIDRKGKARLTTVGLQTSDKLEVIVKALLDE